MRKTIIQYAQLYIPLYLYEYLQWNGINLLKIECKDAYAYGRSVLDILFTKSEQKGSVILATNKTSKPHLDPERVGLLFGMFNTHV